MAVVYTRSAVAARTEAASLSNRNLAHQREGKTRSIVATVPIAAGDDDGSILVMFEVKASWAPRHIWVLNDAITGGTAFELGLFTVAATPVAIDADLFASAVTMATARTAPVDLMFEALDIVEIGKRFYEFPGVTGYNENSRMLLGFLATTIGTVAGDISAILEYEGDD